MDLGQKFNLIDHQRAISSIFSNHELVYKKMDCQSLDSKAFTAEKALLERRNSINQVTYSVVSSLTPSKFWFRLKLETDLPKCNG